MRNPFLLLVLIIGLVVVLAVRVMAQTSRTVYRFTAGIGYSSTNGDGINPYDGLILSGNTLYGTAKSGGSSAAGTVFAVNTDGTGFTNLHSFYGSDGAFPYAGLTLSNNTLYGTASRGGSSNYGIIFAVNTDGTGFTNLHSFNGSDGAFPYAGLVLSGNRLYGTAYSGGSSNHGTIFAVRTDGTGFTNLHSFAYADGANPFAALLLSDNTLYGTTIDGFGTVFSVSIDGQSFTNLHKFSGISHGAMPYAGLILSGKTLYGAAYLGDNDAGAGSVFRVNTDGTGYTNLHIFPTGSSAGANPYGGLALSGDTLYGTTVNGGDFPSKEGTVFAVNTNGTAFRILHSFPSPDGANPRGGLLLSGNTLYGTTTFGGNGTIFSLSFSPQLTIVPAGDNVVLTWPTNYDGLDYNGFSLQCTTNVDSPKGWTTNSSAPVVVNGQNTVTNPISGTQQFYRLSQ